MVFNAFLLVVPLIFIRYGLLSFFGREALQRAGYFPPLEGGERAFFWVYQLTNLILLLAPLLLTVNTGSGLFSVGFTVYLLGIIIYAVSMISFGRPGESGINKTGIYRFSRNPMYLEFFLVFLGLGLLTLSWFYLFVLLVFQLSVHFLILSEERWCLALFGQEYRDYQQRVRRYL